MVAKVSIAMLPSLVLAWSAVCLAALASQGFTVVLVEQREPDTNWPGMMWTNGSPH